VNSFSERDDEPSGSLKLLGIYVVAVQLVASRLVLSSTELVSYMNRKLVAIVPFWNFMKEFLILSIAAPVRFACPGQRVTSCKNCSERESFL
jgi:hypothetical protein